jgi:hypothetical protein
VQCNAGGPQPFICDNGYTILFTLYYILSYLIILHHDIMHLGQKAEPERRRDETGQAGDRDGHRDRDGD